MNKIIILSIILSLLVIIPAGFAAESSVDLADDNLIDYDLANDDLINQDVLEASINDDDSYLGDEPIGNHYYFDSNAEADGNGSIDNPYKTLDDDKIMPDSILHFASGNYNYVPISSDDKVNITIYGESSSNTIINCPLENQTFNVKSLFTIANITFNNIQIMLKDSNALLNASNVNFSNSTALESDIYTDSCGGAIYAFGQNNTIILDNCNFYNNYAFYGGAVFAANADLKITDCHFVNNTAKYYGGAIYQIYGNMSLTESEFDKNHANEGGAIYVFSKNDFSIEGNNFINNYANASAGAIYYFYNENYTIVNNFYENNSARQYNDTYEKSDLIVLADNYTLYRAVFNGNSTNGTLPSYYNLADYGFVSSVKNQANGGNCWAFATMASLESAIIKAIYDMNSSGLIYNYTEYADILEFLNNGGNLSDLIDFSEENMKNVAALYSPFGWQMETNNGGYDDMGVGYLVSWLGPINDADDLYGDYSIFSPILNSMMHVQNIVYLKRDNYTENDMVKRALIDYGAVFISVRMKTKSDSNIGTYVYNTDNSTCNHAVAIVGWDDTIEIPNAPGPGAWIVKNSWGENWGNDNGYFYLSYYDISALRLGENDGAFAIILNDSIKYDKNYQYDVGKTDYFFNSTDTVWYKNVFTSTDNENLSAVSTYFEKPSNWEVSIYVNDVLKSIKSGFSNPGYWTINLLEQVPLIKGDIFEVVFKINVTGDAGFPIAEKVSLNNEFFREGISFVSYDGVNWADLYSIVWNDYPGHHYSNSQVACIKAFTVLTVVDTVTSLDIEYDGFNPVNITAHIIDQYENPVKFGIVLFNLSGVIVPVNVSNGVAKISHIFEKGLNSIFAEFVASGYVTSKANGTVNIRKIPANMIADISVDLDTALVNITLNDTINETVFLVLGDKNYSVQSIDGKATINLTDLPLGESTLRISLYDAVYECNEVEESFNIVPKGTFIIVNDFESMYGSGDEFKIILVDGEGNPIAGRNLVYSLDNVNSTIRTDDNGEVILNIGLIPSVYAFEIWFEGEKMYLTSSNSSLITINKKPVSMIVEISVDLDTALVNITLNDTINENIFIDLGNANYTIKSTDGKASINLTGLNIGLYNVRVSLNDTTYDSIAVELNFTIDSRRTIITLDNMETVYQSGKEYKIILTDEEGNPLGGRVLEYILNNSTDALLTDENGEAYLNISLKTGSYALNVKFLGEKLYIASNGSSIITVKTSVTAQYSNYTYGSKYSVKFLGKDSSPLKNTTVSIVFAGKTYNVKTDANGVAKIDVKLKPGTYTVKITNPNTSEEKTQKIKVLSRITENKNLVMYYGSGSKYKVKVLDDYGNIAKNVSVKFTYRGKTYNKRTDNKGYAYLIIKSKPNKYAISVTYKGFTVKNNVTVKPTIIAKNITKKRAKTVKYTAKLLNSKGKILKSKYLKFKFKSKTYKRKTNSKGIATLSLKYLKKGKYSVYLTYGKLTVKRTIKIT